MKNHNNRASHQPIEDTPDVTEGQDDTATKRPLRDPALQLIAFHELARRIQTDLSPQKFEAALRALLRMRNRGGEPPTPPPPTRNRES